MGTLELVQVDIISHLWRHFFRITVFFKLIGLPSLRRREIDFAIKILFLYPNKNFKTRLFPEKVLTGVCCGRPSYGGSLAERENPPATG